LVARKGDGAANVVVGASHSFAIAIAAGESNDRYGSTGHIKLATDSAEDPTQTAIESTGGVFGVAAMRLARSALVAGIDTTSTTARNSSGSHEERGGEEKSRDTSEHVERGGKLLFR